MIKKKDGENTCIYYVNSTGVYRIATTGANTKYVLEIQRFTTMSHGHDIIKFGNKLKFYDNDMWECHNKITQPIPSTKKKRKPLLTETT